MRLSASGVSSARHALWRMLAFSVSASAALLVVAAGVGSLGAVRVQVLLTFVGLAVGSALAHFYLGVRRERPRLLLLGLAAVVFSQACYLLLVWTGWKTQSALWRLWWVSMVVTVHVAYLIAVRAVRVGRATFADRWTPRCAIAGGVMLGSLALRADLLGGVHPVHKWATALPCAAAVVGSAVVWGRWARRALRGVTVPRRATVAALVVSHLAVLGMGIYLGFRGTPQSGSYEALPSAMAHLSPAAIEVQARADLARLRTAIGGLADLEERMDAYQATVQQRFAAEGRDYYTPQEDEQLRWFFVEYLSYRTALLRLVATYSGSGAVREPKARARCFLLGYAATSAVFRAGLELVHTYRDRPVQRRKLNEAEPAWGIPAGMFDRIYESVGRRRSLMAFDETGAYFLTRRRRWRAAAVWPPDDFDWLAGQIDHCVAYVRDHRLQRHRVWVDLFLERVKGDAYSPAYAVQSMVAEWIGDTRIVQRPPCVSLDQIDALTARLRPGDILLERRNWFLSNAFLPGFWPHAALYVGTVDDLRRLGIADDNAVRERLDDYLAAAPDGQARTVIEAVSEGVVFSSLHHSLHADHVAVLRPRLSERQVAEAIVRAFRHHGKPYDFEFDFSTADKVVCTELVYRAYQGMLDFELERVMGRPTLPAGAIVRKFARERDRPDRELDLVVFLDGEPATGTAREATAADFCASADRPSEFHE